MQLSQNGAAKAQDEFRQKLQKLFDVSKRDYLHGEAVRKLKVFNINNPQIL